MLRSPGAVVTGTSDIIIYTTELCVRDPGLVRWGGGAECKHWLGGPISVWAVAFLVLNDPQWETFLLKVYLTSSACCPQLRDDVIAVCFVYTCTYCISCTLYVKQAWPTVRVHDIIRGWSGEMNKNTYLCCVRNRILIWMCINGWYKDTSSVVFCFFFQSFSIPSKYLYYLTSFRIKGLCMSRPSNFRFKIKKLKTANISFLPFEHDTIFNFFNHKMGIRCLQHTWDNKTPHWNLWTHGRFDDL